MSSNNILGSNAVKIIISAMIAIAIAAIAGAGIAIASNSGEQEPEGPATYEVVERAGDFDDPVSDTPLPDSFSETGSDLCGPIFLGDYEAYLAQLNAERAEAEHIRQEMEEQARQEQEAKAAEEALARAGANTTQAVDQANIAQPTTRVELPAVTLPPISSVPDAASPSGSYEADPNLPSNYRTFTQGAFAGKSIADKIQLMGALARQDMRESGILASVTIAQAILESGWMESGLARYNALFGIKACKMENNWAGSPWTGTAKDFQTGEEYTPGTITTITAAFRTYPNVWASIKDHSSYLINARKGSSARYPGIVGMKDPRAVITIIKNGGYATASDYVDYIMRIINQYDLTRFDR